MTANRVDTPAVRLPAQRHLGVVAAGLCSLFLAYFGVVAGPPQFGRAGGAGKGLAPA